MSLFAATREAGPAWTAGRGAFEQAAVDDHAAFMNDLANDGVIVFAGPLAGSEAGRIRVLLIGDAADEADLRHHLAQDPWEITDRIVTTTIEPWHLLVGADRLPAAQPAGE